MSERNADSTASSDGRRGGDGRGDGTGRDSETADASAELGISSNPVVQWALVYGNRWTVAGVLLGATFALFMVLGAVGIISVRATIQQGALVGVFTALLGVIATVVTIVLSVNQLAMSPQIGPVARQRARFESAMAHRDDVANALNDPTTPVEPVPFLDTTLRSVQQAVDVLDEEMAAADDPEFRREVAQLLDVVSDNTADKRDQLDDTRFRDIGMVRAVITDPVSANLRDVRGLYHRYESQCSPGQGRAFDDLIVAFKRFMIARAYFKAGFLQEQLISFTRAIIYTAVPALLSAYLVTQMMASNPFPGTFLGAPNALWITNVMFVVAASPFAVLLSYTARLSTLAETTIFVSAFRA